MKYYLYTIKQQTTENLYELCMINNSTKFLFYKKTCKSSTGPPNIDLLNANTDRSLICIMRIRSHKLAIETGRYNGIPKYDHTCSH